MRKINNIVLHCTATNPDASVEAIKNYWAEHLGWKNPGYHYIIGRDGSRHILSTIDQVTNGVQGHNHDSIHISYIGGIDENGKAVDNRTQEQKKEQEQIIKELVQVLKDTQPERPNIRGHRDFPGVTKACPCFDAILEFGYLKNL